MVAIQNEVRGIHDTQLLAAVRRVLREVLLPPGPVEFAYRTCEREAVAMLWDMLKRRFESGDSSARRRRAARGCDRRP